MEALGQDVMQHRGWSDLGQVAVAEVHCLSFHQGSYSQPDDSVARPLHDWLIRKEGRSRVVVELIVPHLKPSAASARH